MMFAFGEFPPEYLEYYSNLIQKRPQLQIKNIRHWTTWVIFDDNFNMNY